eukprot:12024924-Alexandrium_andersonii.AAC.1
MTAQRPPSNHPASQGPRRDHTATIEDPPSSHPGAISEYPANAQEPPGSQLGSSEEPLRNDPVTTTQQPSRRGR